MKFNKKKNRNFWIRNSLPSESIVSPSTSRMASSVVGPVCSVHFSPLSLRKTIISRSRFRNEAKCGISSITGLKNNNTNL
jgi:hypothetical protein